MAPATLGFSATMRTRDMAAGAAKRAFDGGAARGARARGYLADRQLTVAIQKEFRLGYAPDDRSALRTLSVKMALERP